MRKRTFYILFIILLLISAFFLVKKYFAFSEKEKILKTLRIAENSLEKKDYSTFMKQFSLQYRDAYGNTWGILYFFLKNTLDRCKRIDISLSNKVIEIEDRKAEVRFLGRGKVLWNNGQVVEEAGRFTIKLQKEGTRWKIIYFTEDPYTFD